MNLDQLIFSGKLWLCCSEMRLASGADSETDTSLRGGLDHWFKGNNGFYRMIIRKKLSFIFGLNQHDNYLGILIRQNSSSKAGFG